MISRRYLLKASTVATLATAATRAPLPALAAQAAPPLGRESLPAYVARTQPGEAAVAYTRLLGAANAFKEGDEIVGVAAPDEATRSLARQLLANTTLGEIDAHAPHRDELWQLLEQTRDEAVYRSIRSMTLADLKAFLLERPEADIHAIIPGLSSDVIAALVRLMSNAELTAAGARVFNPLPGSRIGARGYLGARVQPNSPTDHPEDIRWQVFDAFAYGVGDVVLGTNPVSSEVASVTAIQRTLADLIESFGLEEHLPHCVLAHIDVQAAVEQQAPGVTDLWFQSIAGNDEANATFDISVAKMRGYAAERRGPWGLYFETGQGADFTNGHGHGVDMVTWESRKYGFARALALDVARAGGAAPWVHLNDVAGFIGPEVFRSREQLVRCCLEDIVMGKLHGLCIGLDICATLHMSVSLDDLDWCIDQVMPANPAYLMALPTKIDPMLGYLTTGYQDHVRIRERYGYRVEDRMWQFFQRLGVIDERGQPGPNFGNPLAVYIAYCRARGDQREEGTLRSEGREQLRAVRSRGVFIAEGHGAASYELEPDLDYTIRRITEEARSCIWEQFDADFRAKWASALFLASRSRDREDYILHPESGEQFPEASLLRLAQWQRQMNDFDTVLVISDGLNARALKQGAQLAALVSALREQLAEQGFRLAGEPLIVESGRVRAGYRIGEALFGRRTGVGNLLHIVGERPGTGHNTLSVYLTRAPAGRWAEAGAIDHDGTKVVSGIAETALDPALGAAQVVRLMSASATWSALSSA